jgi:hypothetical protein
MGRYGFEPAGEVLQPGTWQSGSLPPLRREPPDFYAGFGHNPVAAGTPVLRRDRKLVYLSKPALERRYGRAWDHWGDVGNPRAC